MSVINWNQDTDYVYIQYDCVENKSIKCSFDEEMVYIDIGKKTVNMFLFSEIIPDKSSCEIKDNLLSMKLKKKEVKSWSNYSLIASPNSKHKFNNIEKLAERDEDRSLRNNPNNFYKFLSKHSDDESKKAMMKSYYESGGTNLNMNWNEIKSK
jgi:hypothetical protein